MAMMDEILLKRQTLNGSIYFDVTPIKNLTWHTQFGFDVNASKGDTYNPIVQLGSWYRLQNEARTQKNSGNYWSLSNYLTYAMQFGKHGLTAMLGQECWERSEEHTSELQSRQYLVCR